MARIGHGGRLCREDVQALAASGLRMPIGTDLVLHEQLDPEAVLEDGERLSRVVLEAAARYRTPLAMPPMDLRLEQEDLVARIRPSQPPDPFRYTWPPDASDLALACRTAAAIRRKVEALLTEAA
jgi:hypothetical protein